MHMLKQDSDRWLGNENQPPLLREVLDDAIRYWERRRIVYNVILVLVVAGWVVLTWPHFRSALTLNSLFRLFVLAVLANVCYSSAYVVDIALQYSSFRTTWLRVRWILWLVGTLFATVFANYWIADEIYPFVY